MTVTTQNNGARRMRLKSMCVAGLAAPSLLLDHALVPRPCGGAAMVTTVLRRTGRRSCCSTTACSTMFRRPAVQPAGGPRRAVGSGVDVGRERADDPQVAVLLGVVQPVAHDELVGDVEADPPDVDLDLRGVRLAQQGAD